MTAQKIKCRRTACHNDAHPLLKHRDTGEIYCVSCARKINEGTGIEFFKWPTHEEIKAYDATLRE